MSLLQLVEQAESWGEFKKFLFINYPGKSLKNTTTASRVNPEVKMFNNNAKIM